MPTLNAAPEGPGEEGTGPGPDGGDGTGGDGAPGAGAAPSTAAPVTIGWLRCIPPVDPRKRASPSEKMPPSPATSQAPVPAGVLAIATTGWLSRSTLPSTAASPNASVLPLLLTSQ